MRDCRPLIHFSGHESISHLKILKAAEYTQKCKRKTLLGNKKSVWGKQGRNGTMLHRHRIGLGTYCKLPSDKPVGISSSLQQKS